MPKNTSINSQTLPPSASPPSSAAILSRLQSDYPDLIFRAGKKFAFRPPKTIIYESFPKSEFSPVSKNIPSRKEDKNPSKDLSLSKAPQPQPYFALLTLHELSHALLKHKHDNTHISRLKHESEAWERAKQLATHYDIPWGQDEEDFAQDQLDTYRHHLHQKTLCKTCGISRYESPTGTLHCPFCDT